MDIKFNVLVIETFDENLNGKVMGRFKFKDIQTLKATPAKLGSKLREFVIKKAKSGSLPYKEEKNIMYARVTDHVQGDITCLIKPELLQ